MTEIFRKKITDFLQKTKRTPIPYKELYTKISPKKDENVDFNAALKELQDDGTVYENRTGFVLSQSMGMFVATVKRLNKTFGFITRTDDSVDYFVPGRFFMAAMPNDIVLAKEIPSRTGSPEGEIVKIIKENKSTFSGTIIELFGKTMIQPDSFTKNPIALIPQKTDDFVLGDKVLAEVTVRGARHNEHKAVVISSFGASNKAVSCANSILMLNGVHLEFPDDVAAEATKMSTRTITADELKTRTDLRGEVIFTIDSADTKDIDDAISLEKFSSHYTLGVHIADVSHYVTPNSPIDKEAFERGTSVYYANKVVPMLPKELSNGICSLNPQEDRLAFSCLMNVGFDGKLQDFEFKKSVIRSRVKGVYAEINQILAGNEPEEITEKYKEVRKTVDIMEELATILTENKLKRGAPQIETAESKLIIDENNVCIGVGEHERGKSELIIEEFMLMANQAAATLGKKSQVPFVYRIHENPALEKVAQLKETLDKMGIDVPQFTTIKPSHLAKILEQEHDTQFFPVVNKLVLRSMAKAKYSTDPIGHFGLVLSDYAHFTSPIRRYPDLSIHRIMTDIVNGVQIEKVQQRYKAFAPASAEHSTQMELISMRVERSCEDCYKAEYMASHVGEVFDGVIGSVVEYGFYVELPNTVEGLVHISTLPEGSYEFDGLITLRDALSNRQFRVGDAVKVTCTKADVSCGNIDFSLAE